MFFPNFHIRGRSQTTFTRFAFFWPPTHLRLHFLWYKCLQKVNFFDHLPPSSCKRSLWTPPYIIFLIFELKSGQSKYHAWKWKINSLDRRSVKALGQKCQFQISWLYIFFFISNSIERSRICCVHLFQYFKECFVFISGKHLRVDCKIAVN